MRLVGVVVCLLMTCLVGFDSAVAKSNMKAKKSARAKNTTLSFNHLSPTEKVKLVRTLRGLSVQMEQSAAKRSNRRSAGVEINLRMFSEASAKGNRGSPPQTQTTDVNEIQQRTKRFRILEALKAVEESEQIVLKIVAKKNSGQSMTKDDDEAIKLYERRIGTLKALNQNYTSQLGQFNAASEIGMIPERAQAKALLEQIVERDKSQSNSNGSLLASQVPTSTQDKAFTSSPCVFAGAPSDTFLSDGREPCKRPETLKCTPTETGAAPNSGSECGPLYTLGTESECLTSEATNGFQSISQVCAEKYSAPSLEDMAGMEGEKLDQFNTYMTGSLRATEQAIVATCGTREKTDADCGRWTNQLATSVQLAQQNDANRNIIGIDPSIRKFVSTENNPAIDNNPTYTTTANVDSQFQPVTVTPPPAAPAPITPIAASADPEAAVENELSDTEKLLKDSTCTDNGKPTRLPSQTKWNYRCIADCGGEQIMLVTKKNNGRNPPPDANLDEETYLIKISPGELENLGKGEGRRQVRTGSAGPRGRRNETPDQTFRRSLQEKSFFGCDISKSPKGNRAVNTLAKSIRNKVTCESDQLYVRNETLAEDKGNDRGEFRAITSQRGRFADTLPRYKETPQVSKGGTSKNCGISHTTKYNKNMGKNSDTIEWIVEDTDSSKLFSFGAGKNLMKCSAKANEPNSGMGAASEGAIILSSVMNDVKGNDYLKCLNGKGAYPDVQIRPVPDSTNGQPQPRDSNPKTEEVDGEEE